MSKIVTWTIRVMGALNIAFCLLGVAYCIWDLDRNFPRWHLSLDVYIWTLFLVLCVITFGCTLFLGYLGFRLVRSDRRAIRPASFLFAVEITYFVVSTLILWTIPARNSELTLGFFSLPASVFGPQIVYGYPILGIIVCIVLLRIDSSLARKSISL